MTKRTHVVLFVLALCFGISACSDKGPTAPGTTKLATVYVPATTSVVQGKTVDLEPTLDGKNVQPTSCSTPAGIAQVIFDTEKQKYFVRVTGLVIGSDHLVICAVVGANDGSAKVTVVPPPLVLDIEYSWDTPTSFEGDPQGSVTIHIGSFIFNGEPGATNICATVWTPTPSTANTWKCSDVSFERGKTYYIRVGDVKRRLSCNPACGTGFGERVRVGGVLLQRIGAYFVDPRGLVRLDFDQNGKPY